MGAGTAAEIVGNPQALNKWNAATAQEWIYVPDYYPTGGVLFDPGAGFNLGQYSDPTMTKLIQETYLAGTPSQIQARFDAYQAYAVQQLPVLYIPTEENINVVSNLVGGWTRNYNVIISDPPIWYLYWK
jgi:peptide/nickel transport system substrate-binding protein